MTPLFLTGILGLVAVTACWGLATVLYRVSTRASVARKLSILLAVEGLVLVTAGFPEFVLGIPDSWYESRPLMFYLMAGMHHSSDAVMIALYPPFLALALDTALTRPFLSGRFRTALWLATGAVVTWAVFFLSRLSATTLYLMVTLVFIYALIASIHAWRTARSDLARERAGFFALAFGLRDLGWCVSYAISAWFIWTETPSENAMSAFLTMKLVYALGTLLAVPLIAYGILRAHLFDIDLRVRWTIKQSTVGLAIFAIIFAVSEGAERLLSEQLGNYWGLLAAAIIAFSLRPLQAFAERVASAAMPNTRDTPDYRAERKREVYTSAIAEAFQDGDISERERSLLNHLRKSLGISAADAEALEQGVRPMAKPG